MQKNYTLQTPENLIQVFGDVSSSSNKPSVSVPSTPNSLISKSSFVSLCQEQLAAKPIHIGVYLVASSLGLVFIVSSGYLQFEIHNENLEFQRESNRINLAILNANLATARGDNIFHFSNTFLKNFNVLQDYTVLQPYLQNLLSCNLTVTVEPFPIIDFVVPKFELFTPPEPIIIKIPDLQIDFTDFKSSFGKGSFLTL
jgi:hypothetical protein